MDDFLQKSKNRNGESIYWEYVCSFLVVPGSQLGDFTGNPRQVDRKLRETYAKIYDVKHFLASEVAIMSICNHHRAGSQHYKLFNVFSNYLLVFILNH